MPPTRTKPRQPSTQAILDAAAAGTLVAGTTGAPPSSAAVGGTAVSGAQVAAAVAAAIASLRRDRTGDEAAWLWLVNAVRPMLDRPGQPDISDRTLERFARAEGEREDEFYRRMQERLNRDIAAALSKPNVEEEIEKVLRREAAFLAAHEEAAATRVAAAIERDRLKQISPRGAFWLMSPLVKEHTPDCIAMSMGGFWPWSVLDRLHPPMHPGCRCELISEDEARERGLLGSGIPDTTGAEARAQQIIDAYGLLQEAYWTEDLGPTHGAEAAVRLRDLLEAKADSDHAPSQGVMVALYPDPALADELSLTGGEKPEALHLTLAYLGKAPDIEDAKTKVRNAVQRWAAATPRLAGQISGYGVFAPQPGSDDEPVTYASVDLPDLPAAREDLVKALERAGGPPSTDHGFTPHMTLDYASRRPTGLRNLIPVRFDHVTLAWGDEHHTFALGSGELQEARVLDPLDLEELFWDRRYAKGTIWGGRFMPKRGGFAPRIGINEILRALGGTDIKISPRGSTPTPMRVPDVEGMPSPGTATPARPRATRRFGPPRDFNALAQDVHQMAAGLAERHGSTATLGKIEIDQDGFDTEGFRTFAGDITVGPVAAAATARYAELTANQQRVDDDTAAEYYHALRTTIHESIHNVNPLNARAYSTDAAARAMEEAITEEMAHDLTVDYLKQNGGHDALRWLARKPQDLRAKGVYGPQRAGLLALLDEAEVPLAERRELLRQLAFSADPGQRETILGGLIAKAQGTEIQEGRQRVRTMMGNVDALDPLGQGASVLQPANNVDRRMRVHTGARVKVGDRYEGEVSDAGWNADGQWQVEVEVKLEDGDTTWRYPDPSTIEVVKDASRRQLPKGGKVKGVVREEDSVAVVQANGEAENMLVTQVLPEDALGWQAAAVDSEGKPVILRPSSVRSITRVKAQEADTDPEPTETPEPPEPPREALRRTAVEKAADAAHESWREDRLQDGGGYEPRIKKTKDQEWIDAHGGATEVDIANTAFRDLPSDWQEENRIGAQSAVDAILRMRSEEGALDMEALSSEVHDSWVERHDGEKWAKDAGLLKPYADLPEDEKEKDRAFVRHGLKALGIPEPGGAPAELKEVGGPKGFDARNYSDPRRSLITKVRALSPGETLELADGSEIERGKHGDSALIRRPDGSQRRYATANRLSNAEMQGIAKRHGVPWDPQKKQRLDVELALKGMKSHPLASGTGIPELPPVNLPDSLKNPRKGGMASPSTVQAQQIKMARETRAKYYPDKVDVDPERTREHIGKVMENAQIGISLEPDALAGVLRDGRFKTGLELGQTGQDAMEGEELQDYLDGRSKWEEATFGAHPIYGYFFDPTEENPEHVWYGTARVVLKRDVRDRATFTVGDSLNEQETVVPSPLDDPHPHVYSPELDDPFAAKTLGDLDRAGEYVEAQIFGDPPSVDEIESVYLARTPSPALRQMLEDNGISYAVKGEPPKQPQKPTLTDADREGLAELPGDGPGFDELRQGDVDAVDHSTLHAASTQAEGELAGKLEDLAAADRTPPGAPKPAVVARKAKGSGDLPRFADLPEGQWFIYPDVNGQPTERTGRKVGNTADVYFPGQETSRPPFVNPDGPVIPIDEDGQPQGMASPGTGGPQIEGPGYKPRPAKVGMRVAVYHDTGAFGADPQPGTITRVTAKRVRVRFDDDEERLIDPRHLLPWDEPEGMASPGLPQLGLFGKGKDEPLTEEEERSVMEAPPEPVEGIPDYIDVPLTDVKAAGGSNGARFQEDEDGNRWLVKTYKGNRDRVATELLANAIYRDLGVAVPNAGVTEVDVPTYGKTMALTYPLVDGKEKRWSHRDAQLGEGFVADALLANWDVVGLTQDNVLWNNDTPIRLDQGGTLEFRAMGNPKPFGPVPTELWTMNKPGGQAFGRMAITEEGLRAQAKDAELRLTPERIDELVDTAPFADDDMRERVRQALKDRVAWLGRYSRGEEELPKPLSGGDVRDHFATRDEKLETYPEEDAAITFFTSAEGRKAVDDHLHSGAGKDDASPEVQGTVQQLDALLGDAVTRTDEDLYGYLTLPNMESLGTDTPEKLEGKRLQERSYLTLDSNPAPGGVQVRLMLPSGSNALMPSAVEHLDDPTPGRFILPRGAKVLITGGSNEGGQPRLDGIISTR